jgi:multidrug efflux pump subunit AcrA (membrane-fusion protein)
VLKDGKAQRRIVTVGGVTGSSRQVESGVSPGEAVITDGPADMKDDTSVTETH